MKAAKTRPPKATVKGPMKRDDLVVVLWVDILADGNGDPAEAKLHTWETPGYYYGQGKRSGVEVVVIRTSRSPDEKTPDDQSGYICIPLGCVRKVQRVTRGRVVLDLEAA